MVRKLTVTPENFLRSDASFRLNLPRQGVVGPSAASGFDSDPGIRLGRFALSVVGPRIAHAQIEPCIADMQHEYFEALGKKDKWAAWSALCRGTAAVLSHVVRNILGLTFHFERPAFSALHMPERFSDASHLVGQMAYDHATRFRQDHVSDDCLLLALVDYPRTHALLQRCGANVETIRSAVAVRMLPEPDSVTVPDVLPPCSGLAHTWLEALWEANAAKMYLVEPEHLLVAFVRDANYLSKAAKDLIAAGFVRPDVRTPIRST